MEIAVRRSRPGGVGIPFGNSNNPLAKDNCWRRWIAPKLRPLGLGWVNFQVMRRTHTSLMRELKVDPKLTSDQMGHSVDDGGSTKRRDGESVTSLAI